MTLKHIVNWSSSTISKASDTGCRWTAQSCNVKELLDKNLKLGRFSNGWAICEIMKDNEAWIELAKAALEKLEVDFAIRVYRHLNDVSLVWSLEEIMDIEDKKLLSGHIAMMLGDYQLAQDLYLQSSQPVEALHMR